MSGSVGVEEEAARAPESPEPRMEIPMNTPYHATTATPQDFSEPFSPGFVSGFVSECDDDEGGGRDRGDGGGAWGGSLQGLEVLEHGALPLGGARRADSRLLRVSSSGVGQGFFVGAGNAVRAAPGRIALTAARIPACASLVTSTTPSGSWGRGP